MRADQQKNLGLAFRDVAAANAHFPAIISENATLSYAQLWQLVASFAVRMQGLGVGRGSIVALNTGDTVVSVAALLATSLLGSQFVVAGRLLASAKLLQPTHFFHSPEAKGSKQVDFQIIDQSWLPGTDTQAPAFEDDFPGYSDEDDPWLNLHTSGSTGNPKYINLSQRIVFDRTMAIRDDFPTRQTTFASLFSCTSRPFYARALGCLLNGCAIVDSPDVSFWQKIGVNLVCGSPAQATKFFGDRHIDPRIARLEVSGSKLTEAAATDFLKIFETVIDIYGASETNKSFANMLTNDAAGGLVLKGVPLDSIVEIVTERGAPCGPGEIGSVRVQNGYMVSGYLNAPEATEKSFRDGWFYPGDYAQWAENGVLQVIGREDDVINLGGIKVNAHLVDMVIRLAPGIKDAVSFRSPKQGASMELLAFVEFEPLVHREHCLERVRQICQEKLGIAISPRNIRSIDKVPRNEDGEPMRKLCQEILLKRLAEFSGQGVDS